MRGVLGGVGAAARVNCCNISGALFHRCCIIVASLLHCCIIGCVVGAESVGNRVFGD